MKKPSKKIALLFALMAILLCPSISNQKASAEPVTLGIIGTVLGGTALGLSGLHWLKDIFGNDCGGGCCGCGAMSPIPQIVQAPMAAPCAPVYPVAQPMPMPMRQMPMGGCAGGCGGVNVVFNGMQPQMMPQMQPQMMPQYPPMMDPTVRAYW